MGNPKSKIINRPVEKIGGNIKKTAWSAMTESFLLMIMGLLFVIWPDTMVKILAYLIGAFFIIKGGYGIVTYYMDKSQKDYFNNGLLSAIVCVLIGITALIVGQDIANVFRVIIGIVVIYESLVRINTATKLYSVGVETWKAILALALIMLVLGIFITFNTGAVVTLIGWLMIATGVIGIVGDVMFVKHVNIVVERLTRKK